MILQNLFIQILIIIGLSFDGIPVCLNNYEYYSVLLFKWFYLTPTRSRNYIYIRITHWSAHEGWKHLPKKFSNNVLLIAIASCV